MYARSFSEDFAAVEVGDRWGFIDKSGKLVIKSRFREVWNPGFEEGLAKVRFEDKNWGYIDKSGKIIWKSDFN